MIEITTNENLFESKIVEFKRILNDGSDSLSWIKTVVAFANGVGGDLYVGVNDEGMPIGFPKNMVDQQVQIFHRNLKEHVLPLPQTDFTYIKTKNDTYVIKIHINHSSELPVMCTYNNISSTFIREEARTRPANRNDIVNLVLSTESSRFDAALTDRKYDPADFKVLTKKYSLANEGKELTLKILSACGFVNDDEFLTRGALLFADAYNGAETAVKVTKWKGLNKGVNEFKPILDIHKNMIEAIYEAAEAIMDNIDSVERKTNDGRITITDYPERSIFEGLVNAFAHKNYFLQAGLIEVDIFRDRIEITSPGGMVNNLNLSHVEDIQEIKPCRRNEVVVSILEACRIMESEGSGFNKISEDYRLADPSHQPFVDAKDDFFRLTLPNLNYDPGVGVENPPVRFPTDELTNPKQLMVLSYCYNQSRTIKQIAEHLGMSVSTYLRTGIVLPLVERGLLKKSLGHRSDRYLTNKDMVGLM